MSSQDIRTDLSKQHQRVAITTTGRRTGRPHRVEVRLHNVGGRLFIMAGGGRRDWYANMLVHPAFMLHLQGSAAADLEATATPIVDDAKRRSILRALLVQLGRPEEVEERSASSPLVRVDVSL